MGLPPPPDSGNHHPTSCLYEFGYSSNLVLVESAFVYLVYFI